MRAIVWTRYGPPEGLQLREVPRPIPRTSEVLIEVHATAVAAGDVELRALRFSLGLRILVRLLMGAARPRRKILGQEFAGEVHSVGRGVTRFAPGDRVYGTTGFRFGAYAEYLCLPERSGGGAFGFAPANLPDIEAATIPTGALEALHFLRKAGDLRGAKVLVIGAGGGIGIFAVQMAKHFGATVTAVDGPAKQDLLMSIGADRALDYTRADSTLPGEIYDVAFDVVGKSPYAATLASLTPAGVYLLGNSRLSTRIRGFWTSRTSRRTVVSGAARQSSEDLGIVRGLVESGALRTVVDRTFPLEQAADAHRYFESGAAKGRIGLVVRSVPGRGEPNVRFESPENVRSAPGGPASSRPVERSADPHSGRSGIEPAPHGSTADRRGASFPGIP
jgi:NADPH:quinone reductase-like Zn-dependent oxidoreductase